MDDLVLSYGDTKVRVGRLGAGPVDQCLVHRRRKGTLSLEFNQKGNPMKGFQVQDFDPTENLANGLRLVLVVKDNRVERFMEDDESTTPLKSLMERISGWFELGVPAMTMTRRRRPGRAFAPIDNHARVHQGLYRDRRSRAAGAKARSACRPSWRPRCRDADGRRRCRFT